MTKVLKKAYIYLILFFLYAPIITLVIYSFNAGKSRVNWEGFSLRWYVELLGNQEILKALYVTVGCAVLSAIIATFIGTIAAIGIHSMDKFPQALFLNVSYLPMLTPDIVTGVSMMILFVSTLPFLNLGFITMLLAHISFNIPYVIFSVMPKLKQMNLHTYEAALDLGATPAQGLIKVVVPEIMPGIITGMLFAFTLSLDDFVVSFFTTNSVQNLSILIYSMAKRGINPTINALSTIMLTVIILLLLVVNKRSPLTNQR